MVRKLDDQQLVALIQNDPEKGVEQAIRQYGGLCKAIAVRILGNCHQQNIDDCISDTFVKLWRAAYNIDLQKGTNSRKQVISGQAEVKETSFGAGHFSLTIGSISERDDGNEQQNR